MIQSQKRAERRKASTLFLRLVWGGLVAVFAAVGISAALAVSGHIKAATLAALLIGIPGVACGLVGVCGQLIELLFRLITAVEEKKSDVSKKR